MYTQQCWDHQFISKNSFSDNRAASLVGSPRGHVTQFHSAKFYQYFLFHKQPDAISAKWELCLIRNE